MHLPPDSLKLGILATTVKTPIEGSGTAMMISTAISLRTIGSLVSSGVGVSAVVADSSGATVASGETVCDSVTGSGREVAPQFG